MNEASEKYLESVVATLGLRYIPDYRVECLQCHKIWSIKIIQDGSLLCSNKCNRDVYYEPTDDEFLQRIEQKAAKAFAEALAEYCVKPYPLAGR